MSHVIPTGLPARSHPLGDIPSPARCARRQPWWLLLSLLFLTTPLLAQDAKVLTPLRDSLLAKTPISASADSNALLAFAAWTTTTYDADSNLTFQIVGTFVRDLRGGALVEIGSAATQPTSMLRVASLGAGFLVLYNGVKQGTERLLLALVDTNGGLSSSLSDLGDPADTLYLLGDPASGLLILRHSLEDRLWRGRRTDAKGNLDAADDLFGAGPLSFLNLPTGGRLVQTGSGETRYVDSAGFLDSRVIGRGLAATRTLFLEGGGVASIEGGDLALYDDLFAPTASRRIPLPDASEPYAATRILAVDDSERLQLWWMESRFDTTMIRFMRNVASLTDSGFGPPKARDTIEVATFGSSPGSFGVDANYIRGCQNAQRMWVIASYVARDEKNQTFNVSTWATTVTDRAGRISSRDTLYECPPRGPLAILRTPRVPYGRVGLRPGDPLVQLEAPSASRILPQYRPLLIRDWAGPLVSASSFTPMLTQIIGRFDNGRSYGEPLTGTFADSALLKLKDPYRTRDTLRTQTQRVMGRGNVLGCVTYETLWTSVLVNEGPNVQSEWRSSYRVAMYHNGAWRRREIGRGYAPFRITDEPATHMDVPPNEDRLVVLTTLPGYEGHQYQTAIRRFDSIGNVDSLPLPSTTPTGVRAFAALSSRRFVLGYPYQALVLTDRGGSEMISFADTSDSYELRALHGGGLLRFWRSSDDSLQIERYDSALHRTALLRIASSRPSGLPTVVERERNGDIVLLSGTSGGLHATLLDRDLGLLIADTLLSATSDTVAHPAGMFDGDTLHVVWEDYRNGGRSMIYGTSTTLLSRASGVGVEMEREKGGISISRKEGGVRLRAGSTIRLVTLHDLVGREVGRLEVSGRDMFIDCGRLPAGLYVATVETESGRERMTFVYR